MGKEETLLKLKEAESQIRALKDAAEKEKEQTLRNARREVLELRERSTAEADARYREVLSAVQESLRMQREMILGSGREEAARLAALGRANVDRAGDLVLGKFRGAIRA